MEVAFRNEFHSKVHDADCGCVSFGFRWSKPSICRARGEKEVKRHEQQQHAMELGLLLLLPALLLLLMQMVT